MVAPFASKQALGAHVGIKEDTSARKFKDVKIAEFFGPKKGTAGSKRTKAPNVEISEASAVNVPQDTYPTLPRNLQVNTEDSLDWHVLERSAHGEGKVSPVNEEEDYSSGSHLHCSWFADGTTSFNQAGEKHLLGSSE